MEVETTARQQERFRGPQSHSSDIGRAGGIAAATSLSEDIIVAVTFEAAASPDNDTGWIELRMSDCRSISLQVPSRTVVGSRGYYRSVV